MKGSSIVGLATLGSALCIGVAAAAEEGSQTADAGRVLFEQRCGGCHMEGGFGTRVLARRVPEGQDELAKRDVLPVAFTTAVVRQGIGSMPQIREAELGDAELQAIARYLDRGQ